MKKPAKVGKPKGKRGFASMDPDRVREIAALGGRSIPDENRAFSKDRDLAARAGRLGGQKPGK